MFKHWWLAASLPLGVLGLTGAGVAQTKLPVPVRSAAGATDPASTPYTPHLLKNGRYILQKGDELSIKVLDIPELNETVTVGPDGRISVILMSELEAAGSTVEELRERISRRYAEYYREPQVSVMVKSFANLKIFVGGEVERPGLLPLMGDISAASAVLQSGGFKQTARKDHVVLLRNDGQDLPIALILNLKNVLDKGASDVALKPFDVLYVPATKIARVDQFVDQYIRRALPLTLNGGFTYLLGNASSAIRFQ